MWITLKIIDVFNNPQVNMWIKTVDMCIIIFEFIY